MILRRREPLHRKLLREAGLEAPSADPPDLLSRLAGAGIHGLQRPREWDAVVTAEAPGLGGECRSFVALPDGSLLLEDDEEGDVAPLAEAVDTELEPPYRAEAVKRQGSLWGVGARRIRVVELPPEVAGEEVELSSKDGARTLLVDGSRSFGSVRELEQLGAPHEDYVVRGRRLDENLWEVEVSPL